ncbi:MAG: tetratricopeptide repeat protein [Bacteroidaceae bacterium]|nr:tetratricopeptide repeat protein [Bacteroidaceae bacterium]
MDYKAIRQIHKEAYDSLGKRHIIDSLSLVESILQAVGDSGMIDCLYTLRQNYEALLRFVTTSGRMPQDWDEQLQSIGRQLIQLLCQAEATWLASDRSSAIGRMHYVVSSTAHHHSLSDLLSTVNNESENSSAFYDAVDKVATRMLLFPVDISTYGDEIVNSPSVFAQDLYASTLTSSLLLWFDPQKLTLLLRLNSVAVVLASESPSNPLCQSLAARCITGLYLSNLCYEPLLQYFPDLKRDMQATLSQNKAAVRQVWTAIIKSSVTQKVNEEVDSILPELKEAIEQQLSILGDDEDAIHKASENVFDDKMMDRMAGHARKIDDLRRDGFDVNYVSSSNLKRFSFFHDAVHWLYPFSVSVPWVSNVLHDENGQLDKATLGVMHHSYFCDSDSYSYVAMMDYVNHGRSSSLMQKMRKELNEIGDVLYDETFTHPPQNYYVSYVQNLYRFLKLQEEGKDLLNPITLQVARLARHQWLADCLDDETVVDAARVLTRMGQASDTLTLLDFWQQREGSSAPLLMQLGYAYMQTSQWTQALQAFNQSQLLDDSGDATHVLQARCYQALGQWNNALGCLLKHESQHSEDHAAIRAVGNCLIRLQRWDEAAQRFFKLEFLGKTTPAVQRSIAWCLFRQGKLERAESYYRQLCSSDRPLWEDQLNMAHTLLLQSRWDEALSAYRRYIRLFNSADHSADHSSWNQHLNEDYQSFLAPYINADMWLLLTEALSVEEI